MTETKLSIFNGIRCKSNERFRKAARDGNLLILKEATKRELNSHDEDGMTAVHWAAYDGRLEALRIVTGRGGNPDAIDNQGQTALHHAVRRDHINCVSFLINFGCNIWSLDDDGHSALDVAGILGHDHIVRYLDSEIARRCVHDKKSADKCKAKALQDVQRRLRKKDQQLEKQLANFEIGNQEISSDKATDKNKLGVLKKENIEGRKSVSQKVIDTLRLKKLKKHASGMEHEKCATAPSSTAAPALNEKKRSQSVAEISKISSKNVLFGKPVDVDNVDGNAGEKAIAKPLGLFDRPGFGSVSFRNLPVVTMFASQTTEIFVEDSRKSNENCQLKSFLASLALDEFYPTFEKEQISMNCLQLLSEDDLIDLGLPMGPRKLILDSFQSQNF